MIYEDLYRPGLSIIIYLPMKNPKEYNPIIIRFINPEAIDE